MKNTHSLLVTCILTVFLIQIGFGQNQKLAQTGMKFLSTSLDARASGLGEAVTAIEGNSLALFYNPASMARTEQMFDISMGQVNYIADINYIYGTASYQPGQGEWGVFGISFISVDYGDLLGTIRAENEQGFLDVGVFSPVAFSFGVGYSRSLTNQFSVGGHIKYVKQDLTGGFVNFSSDQSGIAVETAKDVLVVDFGVLYNTGYKSLNLGMSIRNFSQEITYLTESFQLPLMLNIGLSMNVMDIFENDDNVHALLVSVDAKHPRDYPEQLAFGAEYVFMEMFAMRAGYSFPNDEHGFSAGLGFHKSISDYQFGIDYSYTPFGIFDDVHRFTIQLGM